MRGSGFTRGVMGFGKNYFGTNITSMNPSSISRLLNSSTLSKSFGNLNFRTVTLESINCNNYLSSELNLMESDMKQVVPSEESTIDRLLEVKDQIVLDIIIEPAQWTSKRADI